MPKYIIHILCRRYNNNSSNKNYNINNNTNNHNISINNNNINNNNNNNNNDNSNNNKIIIIILILSQSINTHKSIIQSTKQLYYCKSAITSELTHSICDASLISDIANIS